MNSYEEQEKAAYRKAEKLIAEQNRKHKIVFRAAVSSCVCTAACAGIWLLTSDNIKSLPKNDPSVSTIIEYDPSVSEVNYITVTTEHDLPVITISTSSSAVKKTLTTNVSSTEMKKAATQTTAKNSQTFTQTSAVSSAAETVHTDNSYSDKVDPSEAVSVPEHKLCDTVPSVTSLNTTALSGTVTIMRSEHILTAASNTTIDTAVSTIAKSTDTSLSSFSNTNVTMVSDTSTSTTTTVLQNEFDNTAYDLKKVRISKFKVDKFLGTTLDLSNHELSEGKVFSINGISKEYAVIITHDDQNYYLYTNNNYIPLNLEQFIDDTSLKQEASIKNIVIYNNDIFHIYTEDHSTLIWKMLNSNADSECIKKEKLPALLNKKAEIIMDIPILGLYDTKITIYNQGILKAELSEDIYFNIDEMIVENFIKDLDKLHF
ncbi:MAG: hypothetical protein BWZ04_01489 [Firmicutes bacterium ADurb.BinA205]|nr:MAG: hypothetical protein BWZ04_01489 [Firmicutes bacterium ADurb.BinA205]